MKTNFLLFKSEKPETGIIWGYAIYALIGVILLSIPWFHHNNINFVDNLFTAVSAISTTGLSTVSTANDYTILGQIVILLLIQLGGIGYMTFGSFIILSTRRSISQHREEIHKTAFSLPKDFKINKFIVSIIIYTIIIEAIGALLLLPVFYNDARTNFVWSSVFHSISSFCTAGFSLYNDSFILYANNYYLNAIIAVLSILGAIGYIVMVDVWLLIRGKKKEITFTSKIILFSTFILLLFGTLFLIADTLKSDNATINNSLITSFFQAMTALTTVGFNTVNIHELSSFSIFILTILMIIGASPSGTGGGIKSTTVSSLTGVIHSLFSFKKDYINYEIGRELPLEKKSNSLVNLFKRKAIVKRVEEINKIDEEISHINKNLGSIFGDVFEIKLMGHTIPFDRVVQAIVSFTFYIAILFLGILLLLFVDKSTFQEIFFEAASGLGTVGLSLGITSNLSTLGKYVIIALMFIGRLGPITFGVFLFSRKPKNREKNKYEDIVL